MVALIDSCCFVSLAISVEGTPNFRNIFIQNLFNINLQHRSFSVVDVLFEILQRCDSVNTRSFDACRLSQTPWAWRCKEQAAVTTPDVSACYLKSRYHWLGSMHLFLKIFIVTDQFVHWGETVSKFIHFHSVNLCVVMNVRLQVNSRSLSGCSVTFSTSGGGLLSASGNGDYQPPGRWQGDAPHGPTSTGRSRFIRTQLIRHWGISKLFKKKISHFDLFCVILHSNFFSQGFYLLT